MIPNKYSIQNILLEMKINSLKNIIFLNWYVHCIVEPRKSVWKLFILNAYTFKILNKYNIWFSFALKENTLYPGAWELQGTKPGLRAYFGPWADKIIRMSSNKYVIVTNHCTITTSYMITIRWAIIINRLLSFLTKNSVDRYKSISTYLIIHCLKTGQQ